METARIGATPKGGICRLTLTELDREVRDWFKARAQALGCTVTVDDMGTMFARRAGQRADVPPIAMGSHLDTQPTGGKFDGALGVLAALEALRTLHSAGYETFAPIEVVNWTNEEGARFAPALIASGVFAGVFTRDWAAARADRSGETFGAALDKIGYRGPEKCGAHKLSAFFEVHIEQGPYLEAEGKDIGVVTGVQAMRWYEVDGDRPGYPCRHHADAAPARRAARRRAPGRSRQRRRAARQERGRHRRLARGEAGRAERGARRSVLHDRYALSRSRRARPHGKRDRAGGEKARSRARPADRAQEHLDAAAAGLRCRLASPRCAKARASQVFPPAT